MHDDIITDLALTEPTTTALAVTMSPQEQIDHGHEAAKALMGVVNSCGLSYNCGGAKPHLGYEAWVTLAKFNGCTIDVVRSNRLDPPEEGYEAEAAVIDATGRRIGGAVMQCSRDEPRWARAENYAIRSMAQTRACSKAARMVYSWIAVLAGYSPTPYEEMSGVKRGNKGTQGDQGDQDIDAMEREQTTVPLCPNCQSAMDLRHGSKGDFWGCSEYRITGCKGTRNA